MARVGIGLGSNLGDRVSNLSKAIVCLGDARSTSHLLVSGLYETAPVKCPPDSPDFFNCVIEIEFLTIAYTQLYHYTVYMRVHMYVITHAYECMHIYM